MCVVAIDTGKIKSSSPHLHNVLVTVETRRQIEDAAFDILQNILN